MDGYTFNQIVCFLKSDSGVEKERAREIVGRVKFFVNEKGEVPKEKIKDLLEDEELAKNFFNIVDVSF